MIGTTLSLSLPLLSDTMTGVVTKTATALSQLATSIADLATPSAININTALAFNGNWALNCGGVILADGNAPTAAGSLYYHNGEFYAIDSTSAIQLTSDGAINIASLGTIGGDYGGSDPALESYNAASSEYRFYADAGAGTFANLRALSAILVTSSGSGSVQIEPAASVTGAKTITLPDPPASLELLTMDASGNIAPATDSLLSNLRNWTTQGAFAIGDVVTGVGVTQQDGTRMLELQGSSTTGTADVRLPPAPSAVAKFVSITFEISCSVNVTVSLEDYAGTTLASGPVTATALRTVTLSPTAQTVNQLFLHITPVSDGLPTVSLRVHQVTWQFPS